MFLPNMGISGPQLTEAQTQKHLSKNVFFPNIGVSGPQSTEVETNQNTYESLSSEAIKLHKKSISHL